MSIPVTPLMWISAVLPILVLLVLMIKFNWSAVHASEVGVFIVVTTGAVIYRADIRLLVIESVKGLWSALIILSIILTAILMYQVSNEAGTFLVIRSGMRKLLPNELVLVLATGWVFESFLQGITGFGVPVAVGAPLMIGLGVKPLWAVIIPLLGQSWGNTYGTLAAAWDALVSSSGLSAGSYEYWNTAFWTALFILIWNAVIGFSICWFYGKGEALKKGFPVVLVLVLIQGGGELLMSQINTTLACFLPSCFSFLVILLYGRIKGYREEWHIEDSQIMDRTAGKIKKNPTLSDMTLIQAFVPYLLLSVIALIVLLVKPVNAFLGRFSLGMAFPQTQTGYGVINEASACYLPFKPFTHASMFLMISFLASMIYYGKHGWIKRCSIRRILSKSAAMTAPPGMAVIGLVIMARIMSATGQTAVLADGISGIFGKVYVILSPMVGLVGTFITGSNMSSNVLFGDFQVTAAKLLRMNPAVILGAQSAGGSIGSSISPSNIILGTTTAGISGNEGNIMKRIIVIAVPTAFAIGVVVYGIAVL